MKFINIKTGNTLVVENKDAIALMQGSKNYEEVKDTKKGGKRKSDDGDPNEGEPNDDK